MCVYQVIMRKPEEFKIECLSTIKNLFPADSLPFYAGLSLYTERERERERERESVCV